MTFHEHIHAQIVAQLAGTLANPVVQLNDALRLLAKWRSVLIQNTFMQHNGTVVMQGPMAGLDFLPQSAEGCHIAKIIGCYEQPLLPYVEQAIQKNYPTLLHIGCAEGYYAVGMARCMPNTCVYAFDTNTKAQNVCAALAQKNGVSERIVIGGTFKSADFATFAGQNVLVFCDIEGAEGTVLDPQYAPALAAMDIIVEVHECLIPGMTEVLRQRFQHTHHINLVEDDGQRHLGAMPVWFRNLAHLDQLLAVWEWRSGPTPWLVMQVKKATGFPLSRE